MDDDIHKMNCECIDSLLQSENWNYGLEIILIESNKQSRYVYDEQVKILVPDEMFNFHRFLNIGIKASKSDFVALCNNDIIFSKNWFSEILKVKSKRKDILCFSPIDRDYTTMSYDLFPDTKDYYVGWDNKYHFSAWCFVLDRKIFNITGYLDEIFNFYAADDDFLMTLRKYALDNALVTKSYVKHLSQQITKKIDEAKSPRITDREKYPIPEKYKKQYAWLWDDVRHYEAFFKMERKWGNPKTTKRINRMLNKFPVLRKRFITKILYGKKMNVFFSKVTRI